MKNYPATVAKEQIKIITEMREIMKLEVADIPQERLTELAKQVREYDRTHLQEFILMR